MTDPDVTRFPGVHQRLDSAVYWFALRAPADLAHHYPSRWAVRQSLKTKDLRQANDKAKALQAEWAERFASLRKADNPQPVDLSPALCATIAAELRRWVLEADDNLRSFPEGSRALLAREARQAAAELDKTPQGQRLSALLPPAMFTGLTIGSAHAVDHQPPEVDPLAGLSDAEHAAVVRWNAEGAATASTDMARRNLRGVLPLADAVARSMGLAVEWTSPEGRDGLLVCLKAYTAACAEAVRRDAGEVVDTPLPAVAQQGHQQAPQRAVAASATPPKGHSFRDLYDAWEKAKPGRPVKTLATYSAAADKLETLLPGRTVESLTREDGRNVVAALLAEAQAKGGKAQNTAVNLLGRFKTLMAQAADLEWIHRNPLQGRTIERVKSDRAPWKLPDLVKLFNDPLFTAYQLPTDSLGGKDAAYWLPLLGLFTGARISELAQLHTDDVRDDPEAGWIFSIEEDADEGQRVKNAHSIRRIPVHPELQRLGFLDYWKDTAKRGPGPLWPALARTDLNGAGGKASQWFGDYKTAKGFGPELVFHSFRHTMETRMRALEVPAYLIDAITGHAGKTVSAKYDHPEPSTLRPVLARLQFPGLHLPRVYPVPEGYAKSDEPPA